MKIYTQVVMLLTVLLWSTGTISARVNSITGGLTVGYQYKDRKDEPSQATEETEKSKESMENSEENDKQNVREINLSPSLIITSKGSKDNIEIRYNPSFTYDHELEEDDIDHDLSVNGYRQLSSRWLVQADSHFVMADRQTTSLDETDIMTESGSEADLDESETELSDRYGRRRYWSSETSFSTRYSYLEDSDLTLSYSYNVLRNEEAEDGDDPYRDYTVHDGSLSLSYRYNPQWKVTGFAQYVEGDYFPSDPADTDGDEDDSETNNRTTEAEDEEALDDRQVLLQHTYGGGTLDSDIFPRNPLYLKYGYHSYDYNSSKRHDMIIQNVTLGWKKEFSEYLNLSLSIGPTLVKPDERERYWGYNGQAALSYQFENGKFSLVYKKGYDKDMFSSVDEETLSDFYVVKADLSYNLFEDLSVALFGSFRHDDKEKVSLLDEEDTADEQTQEDVAGELVDYYEKKYTVGARANYRFGRWYTATLGYRYTDFDSEQEDEDYHESLVYLTLQVRKELLRW